MKRFFVCVSLCAQAMSYSADAKPIAFARGATLMSEYGGGSMIEAQAFYAPSYRYSLGVSALRLENASATRDQNVVRANYLLKRWNLPKAQGNAFVYGGLGSANERGLACSFVGFASSAGWQADYETRWFYSSMRMDWNHSNSKTFRVDTAQIGFAPYAHDYSDWATFFVLQARNYQGKLENRAIYSGVETAAIIRFFRGNFWLEAGITNDGKPQAMLMLNY
jgi:hypothetical protein